MSGTTKKLSFVFNSDGICRECGVEGRIVIDDSDTITNLCIPCSITLILLRSEHGKYRALQLEHIIERDLPDRVLQLDDSNSFSYLSARVFACQCGICQDMVPGVQNQRFIAYNSPFQWCFACISTHVPNVGDFHVAHALSDPHAPLFYDADVGAVIRDRHRRTQRMIARHQKIACYSIIDYDLSWANPFSYTYISVLNKKIVRLVRLYKSESFFCQGHLLKNICDSEVDVIRDAHALTYRIERIRCIRNILNQEFEVITELAFLICEYVFAESTLLQCFSLKRMPQPS